MASPYLQVLCMLQWVVISFKLGVYLTSKLKSPTVFLSTLTAILIYLNFFTHHYIGDYRWYLAVFALGLYARTIVYFTPYDKPRKMPLLFAFMLIGFFIWLAENMGTFIGIWRYPNQIGAWSMVHVSKWSAWALLVIMTFTIVANLKHIKKVFTFHETNATKKTALNRTVFKNKHVQLVSASTGCRTTCTLTIGFR